MTEAQRMAPWIPTGALRWNVPNRTTTRAPVLEQELHNLKTGEVRWRSIPVHVDDRTYGEAV